jgi:hypothetical protein
MRYDALPAKEELSTLWVPTAKLSDAVWVVAPEAAKLM